MCIQGLEKGNDTDKHRGVVVLKLRGKLFYSIVAGGQQSVKEISSRVYYK